MKKIKFNVGADAAEATSDSESFYDGPTPPKGVYRTRLKFLKLKTNKNNDPMLNGIMEIEEPKGSDKAKYNGYGIWFNINVTRQGAPYVNNFLDTLGFNKKAFWATGGVTVDENEDPPTVTKIGAKTVGEGHLARLRTKFKAASGGYDESLQVAGAGFLPLSASDEDAETWDEDSDESEEVADDVVDEVADDEESEEGDEEEEAAEEPEEDAWTLDELKEQSRVDLKELLKEWSPEFKVLKRHTDDELAEAVWEAMTGDAEESDEEEEEEAPF